MEHWFCEIKFHDHITKFAPSIILNQSFNMCLLLKINIDTLYEACLADSYTFLGGMPDVCFLLSNIFTLNLCLVFILEMQKSYYTSPFYVFPSFCNGSHFVVTTYMHNIEDVLAVTKSIAYSYFLSACSIHNVSILIDKCLSAPYFLYLRVDLFLPVLDQTKCGTLASYLSRCCLPSSLGAYSYITISYWNTGFDMITKVKQHQAWSIPRWKIACEY